MISAKVPDSERMHGMIARHRADQPYSKEFWTALSYIDTQVARISALTSLQSNLLDLINRGKQSIPPVPAWGAAVSSLLEQQAHAATQDVIPAFLKTLSEIGQSAGPLKDLLDEIKAHETR